MAFAREHGVPHAPQSDSVLVDVSQPFVSTPSQLAKPALHVAMRQLPVEQVALAFVRAHPVPQLPQSLVVLSGVSHPFSSMPSQFAKPLAHAPMRQVPLEQSAVAFGRVHTVPQAPHDDVVLSGVSQPLLSTPSQFEKPGLHEKIAQLPVAQVAVALLRAHGSPHAPQSAVVRSDVSQPLASITSQFANPGSQVPMRQEPVEHVELAWSRSQSTPHAPQSKVVRSDVSHPFSTTPSQSA